MAAKTGVGRSAFPAAHGDDLTGLRERRTRFVGGRRTGRRGQKEKQKGAHPNRTQADAHGSASPGTLAMEAGLIRNGEGAR